MPSDKRRQWLVASFLVGAILAPASVAAASGALFVGAQLGGSSLAADIEGPTWITAQRCLVRFWQPMRVTILVKVIG